MIKKDKNKKINKKNKDFKDKSNEINLNEPLRDIIIATEVLPEVLPILPLVSRPMFPGMMIPIIITGHDIINVVTEAYQSKNRLIGAVLVKELNEDNQLESELFKFGTVIKIHKMFQVTEDSAQVLIQGLKRFKYIGL